MIASILFNHTKLIGVNEFLPNTDY